MKKVIAVIAIVLAFFMLTAQSCMEPTVSGQQANVRAVERATNSASEVVPVPRVQNFQERQVIARWAETFDERAMTCYIYLFMHGVPTPIGYYVTNGKPASSRSYLTPGHREYRSGSEGAVINEELMDIDGTYGDNNAGIRFFTASGIAVEWTGPYLFSNRPLPINVPKWGE